MSIDNRNQNYVCCGCRQHRRCEQGAEVSCPLCREPMFDLGRKWRIPRKGQLKAWKALASRVAAIKEETRQRAGRPSDYGPVTLETYQFSFARYSWQWLQSCFVRSGGRPITRT